MNFLTQLLTDISQSEYKKKCKQNHSKICHNRKKLQLSYNAFKIGLRIFVGKNIIPLFEDNKIIVIHIFGLKAKPSFLG